MRHKPRTKFVTISGINVSVRVAQNWFKRFHSGNFDVKDEPRSGNPVTDKVDAILEKGLGCLAGGGGCVYLCASYLYSPHVSTTNSDSSTTDLPQQTTPSVDNMKTNGDECDSSSRKTEASIGDWLTGGPPGSKTTVLVFRSCVLASQTSSVEMVEQAPTTSFKSVGNNTGTSVLLNKAKHMAKRLVAEPHKSSVTPRNVMHEVLETFGTAKYTGTAYVVRHVSDTSVPEEVEDENVQHDISEHKRNIDDVLKDIEKIELKNNYFLENSEPSPPSALAEPALLNSSRPSSPASKGTATKSKRNFKGKIKNNKIQQQNVSPVNSEDSENLLIEPENFQVLDIDYMPARIFRITYKLVNTETKLLHRLLKAHGLEELPHDAKEFNLLWSGIHPKPDLLRSLSPYQRVNHFPRSYELTRKDKLFKNIEKMQYFRGLKNFDFIPTTFLMPNEYKDLCTAHFKTKGPWIVKPAASSRGRGIYIVNTPEQIPKGDNVVVAKYIDKPLLIGGHKCDLRLCDDPNAGNIGHKWTLSALLRHLRKQGRDTTALMASVEDLVIKSILSSAQTMTVAARAFVPNFFNCFELFGFDILIDDMLKPWLLEINLSPSLACDSPLDARVKSALLADTLTLVGLPAVSIVTGDNTNSLKMRIGACRRVHSAENVNTRSKGTGGNGTGALTSEELRLVRAVRAQYARRGGYVRIFPSQNSWQKYSQYLGIYGFKMLLPVVLKLLDGVVTDPVNGIPICSTSLNNSVPYAVVQHNYNLLIHAHVLPHFQNTQQTTNLTDTPERLKRYEAVKITSTAPAVSLGEPAVLPACDVRRAKELVKRQLREGMKLTAFESLNCAETKPLATASEEIKSKKLADCTRSRINVRTVQRTKFGRTALYLRIANYPVRRMGESRRAFGMFLTLVLKRISTPSNDQTVQHAGFVSKFLKRASCSLRIPYNNVKAPPLKMSDKDRCAIIAKHLNDFLYVYHRETDLYTNSEDQEGCVSNIHFAQFLYGASEADLEDVLLVFLRSQKQVATFIGDGRTLYCIDLPPSSLSAPAPRGHTLLRYLACLSAVNARKYKSINPPTDEPLEHMEIPKVSPAFSSNSNTLLKESLKEEKPLEQALRYARS
ncbi:Tubulin polyglutamylase TTLL5 [Eumeta japonica]|uniref:Tubulin--tyrosine ligase-like protein 5 n=1 Tax=Eumeta variegata TaxID=151549 RepID=A0A4C1UD88_EUMVA|nr:Tubulin polyglutamylase TTLL5 [Eumeta japonica]